MKSDVAIVGGGFSANAMAIHLLEKLPPGKNLTVVGKSEGFGRGVAYGTRKSHHRLNVPAGRMSLWQDRADDLVEWLAHNNEGQNGQSYGPEDFIPRGLYGDYIQSRLQDVLTRNDNRARIRFVDSVAEAFEPSQDGRHRYKLANGQILEASQSVLCLGATASGLPLPASRIGVDDQYLVANPWSHDWLSGIGQNDHVLFIGSGLTMVDQLMSLTDSGHKGQVTVISRHGLLPLAHQVPRSHPLTPSVTPDAQLPLSELLHTLRKAAESSPDWRSAIDGLRPLTQRFWQSFNDEQRKRFLRHGAAWWNIHRHRMAPDIAEFVANQTRSGRLRVVAGWLDGIVEQDGRAGVLIRPRHHHGEPEGDGQCRSREKFGLTIVPVDRVVNCTGLERCAIGRIPILRNMMAKGLVRSDDLGLGVDVDDQSRIVDHKGRSQEGLYAVGPMTIGRFWEIFAVPDIRQQVSDISQKISLGV